jgi:hypothetical protein
VTVNQRSRLAEQAGGLVGQLQVGGLAGGSQSGGDLLGSLPDLAALGLGERTAAAGASAGQVGLFGVQVLGQDDLFPLVLEERRGEGCGCGGIRPAEAEGALVGDDGGAAGLPDDAVGEAIDVQDLDLLADPGVRDEEAELGLEGFGQVAGEGGDQDGRRGAFGQEGGAVQDGDRLARCRGRR